MQFPRCLPLRFCKTIQNPVAWQNADTKNQLESLTADTSQPSIIRSPACKLAALDRQVNKRKHWKGAMFGEIFFRVLFFFHQKLHLGEVM